MPYLAVMGCLIDLCSDFNELSVHIIEPSPVLYRLKRRLLIASLARGDIRYLIGQRGRSVDLDCLAGHWFYVCELL